jgi:hypothetical protein
MITFTVRLGIEAVRFLAATSVDESARAALAALTGVGDGRIRRVTAGKLHAHLQRTPGEADLAAVTQTAGRIYRGVRY